LNLRIAMRRNSLVSLLLLVGFMLSSLSFLYGFCALKSIRTQERLYYDDTRIYSLTPMVSLAYGDVSNRLNAFLHAYNEKVGRLVLSLGESGEIHTYLKGQSLPPNFGNGFTGGSTPEILIGSGLTGSSVRIGDQFELYSVAYKVVGILELSPFHIVNNLGFNDILPLKQIEVFLYDKPSSPLRNELDVNIQKYFPEFEIHSPQVVTIADEYNLGSTMLLAALLMLMAFGNLSYLYRYLLLRRKHDYAVLRILGCSHVRGALLLLIELLLLTIIQFIVSSFMYQLLLDPLFARTSLNYFSGMATFQDHLVLLAAIILLVGLIFIPVIRKYSALSPSRLKTVEMRWI
jgi:hypothetical protein